MSFQQVCLIKFVLYLPKWANGDKNFVIKTYVAPWTPGPGAIYLVPQFKVLPVSVVSYIWHLP